MEFGILGPLLVRDETGGRQITAAKQRVVLAALLLRPRQIVPVDSLAETMWDGYPPKTATTCLRNYVMRLRNGLGPAGERISSRAGGYLIEVDESELDSMRFTGLRDAGAAAFHEGAFERAASTLGDALGLWRGPALADVPSDTLHRDEVPRLAEIRLDTLELKLEAESRLGRYGPVINELRGLTETHPERERLWVQLMTALYHSGRQSEALAAYRRIRRILTEEIGVEPGPELQAVHQRILTADPILDPRHIGRTAATTASAHRNSPAAHSRAASSAAQAAERTVVVTPFQIPADLADFTGRIREQGELVARLIGPGRRAAEPSTNLIPIGHALSSAASPSTSSATGLATVITGPPGIGKSALAIHVAHTVRHSFPDGTLFANLRGAGNVPLRPDDVLASFLRALGVPASAVPDALDDRAALFRSVLADRRLLIVLDNASGHAQVSPLLPGTASSAALITSQNRLPELAGAHRVGLGLLTPHEAAQLLARIAGPTRTRAEPLAVAEVVTACGRLPLALRIAGARLAARPQWNVRHLADRLADGERLLDELKAGSLDVRAGFARGYDALEPAAARAFRLVALLGTPAVSIETAAALLDVPAVQAERSLENLVDIHLLVSEQPGCYGYHDLIRVFALERALAEDSKSERTQAVDRAQRAAQAQALMHRPRILPIAYTSTAGCQSTLRFGRAQPLSTRFSAVA